MKHRFALCILPFIVCGCAGTPAGGRGQSTEHEEMALGWIDRAVLAQPPFEEFKISYDSVQVQSEFVALLQEVQDSVEVLIFIGTWCSDSKREVPRFLKIADRVGIPAERIKLYGVDRTKRSTDGLPQQYDIQLIPTLIFLREGAEIGRITEAPRTSMEADILSILATARAR
jgi:thiol-disulfide isomerase/thioredoxin